jgi:hypothetical protein
VFCCIGVTVPAPLDELPPELELPTLHAAKANTDTASALANPNRRKVSSGLYGQPNPFASSRRCYRITAT